MCPAGAGWSAYSSSCRAGRKVPKVILISAFCSDSVVSEAVDLGGQLLFDKACGGERPADRMRALFSRGPGGANTRWS